MDSLLITIKLRLLSHCQLSRIKLLFGSDDPTEGRGEEGKEGEGIDQEKSQIKSPFDLDPWRNFSAAEKTILVHDSTSPPLPPLSSAAIINLRG